MDWDLSIHKYSISQENKIIDSNQLDLFYPSKYENGKIINIDLDFVNIEWKIFVYQYTFIFFAILLEYCYRNNFIPVEIQELWKIKWNIPDASNSLDFSDFAENFFLVNLNTEIHLSIEISSPMNFYYESEMTENWISFNKYEIEEGGEHINLEKWLTIQKKEVWPMIKALMHLPWRSFNGNKIILQIFLEEMKKKNS